MYMYYILNINSNLRMVFIINLYLRYRVTELFIPLQFNLNSKSGILVLLLMPTFDPTIIIWNRSNMNPVDKEILKSLNQKVAPGVELSEKKEQLIKDLMETQKGNMIPISKKSVNTNNETRFPFHYNILKIVGFETAGEQYVLYGTLGIFIYNAYPDWRKAYFLKKWCHEKDPSLKDILLARSQISHDMSKYGEETGPQYVKHLRNCVKFWSVFPLSYISYISVRGVYCYCKNIFYSNENNK